MRISDVDPDELDDRPRRRRAVVVVGALAVLAAAVVGGVVLFGGDDDEPTADSVPATDTPVVTEDTTGEGIDVVGPDPNGFPDWGSDYVGPELALLHRRVASLERTVETLSDRLTHDPHLAASLHEVLSTAAAIRSTASILAETDGLEPEWRDRFHRNLNDDSRRLAESSKALVGYLDDNDTSEMQRGVPREEAEAFLAARGHHFPGLESGEQSPDDILRGAKDLAGRAARHIVRDILLQYQQDAQALPFDIFSAALSRLGPDPAVLAAELRADLPAVMRRLAAMSDEHMPGGAGLVIVDAAGSILFRKPVAGFALPRFGAPCPLWPLFLALSRPLVQVRRRITQVGRGTAHFDCLALAWPQGTTGYSDHPLYHAIMLVLPVRPSEAERDSLLQVGSTCRVCPRPACPARREPSILREGF